VPTLKNKPNWNAFIRLIQHAKNAKQLSELLDFFFTHDEKESLNLRIELISELLKGDLTQRDISQHLEISIAKITRGSNQLKSASPELKKFLEKMLA